MKLIATKAMLFGGRDLKVGDEFEANDRDARVLKAIRKAKDVAESAPEIPKQPRDPLDHDGDGKKGGSVKGAKYKRRDMQVED
ncbi:MAG: hypothetical protein CFE29_03150 [Bradyrhizobiaceae bacterium PARB1]|jgi:hypothetical protein|nr:MAG: hypothetical protein CFE29_03150 [Bradyrhizobiaceae bacterium PARB1]